jgi:hypothetical protein
MIAWGRLIRFSIMAWGAFTLSVRVSVSANLVSDQSILHQRKPASVGKETEQKSLDIKSRHELRAINHLEKRNQFKNELLYSEWWKRDQDGLETPFNSRW